MEAQLQPPSNERHRYDEDPHQSAALHSSEGEHNHHGEKKSVLKKVKDKAKKIKDTITKHGHEHEHEHDQISEEEDDEDEEVEKDPEIHGAPVYGSSVISGTALPTQTHVNLEKPTDTREDRYTPMTQIPNVGGEVNRSAGAATGDDLRRASSDFGPFEYSRTREDRYIPLEGSGINRPAGAAAGADVRPFEYNETLYDRPNVTQAEQGNVTEAKVKIGPLVGLEEDPHSPATTPAQLIAPSNYQSKVADPTGQGGKEADVAPLARRFDDMKIRDQAGPQPDSYTGRDVGDRTALKPGPESESYTGSHGQFAPQKNPVDDEFKPESHTGVENSGTGLKRCHPGESESMPVDITAGKISAVASVIADKAVSAKNLVASTLGYGDQSVEGQEGLSRKSDSGHKDESGAGQTDKGVSVKGYLVEKLSPGDEDSEAITGALHKKKEGMGERVKESKEVAARLGSGKDNRREGEDAFAAGSESSGAGVVDRLKDAVGVWLGKSRGVETAKHSVEQSYVSDVGSAPGEVVSSHEKRLQESGN